MSKILLFIASDGERGSKSQVMGEGYPCEVRRESEIIAKTDCLSVPSVINTFTSLNNLIRC